MRASNTEVLQGGGRGESEEEEQEDCMYCGQAVEVRANEMSMCCDCAGMAIENLHVLENQYVALQAERDALSVVVEAVKHYFNARDSGVAWGKVLKRKYEWPIHEALNAMVERTVP